MSETRFRWPIGEINERDSKTYDEIVGDINKTLLDLVLRSCENAGFKVHNLSCGDTYFIFSGAPNSRCTFTMSPLMPGWRFGLWLEGQLLLQDNFPEDSDVDDRTPVIELFAQHVSLIDKFKPSRSPILAKIELWEMRALLKGDEWACRAIPKRFASVAIALQRHPAIVYNEACDPEYPPTKSLIKQMIKDIASDIFETTSDNIRLRLGVRWAKKMKQEAEKNPAFKSIRLYHNELDQRIHTWPPVSLICSMDENLTDDEQEDAIYSVFDKSTHLRLTHGNEVVRVNFIAGHGDERGWYSFFD